MRNTLWMAASAVAIGLAGIASGQSAPPPGPSVSMPAADVIAGRRAAFRFSLGPFVAIKAGLDGGADLKTLVGPARNLAGWAKALPGMFPAGSGVAPSGALPNVWTDNAGFRAKAADYQAATEKLAAALGAGDKDGATAAWSAVKDSCGACHTNYRKAEEHH